MSEVLNIEYHKRKLVLAALNKYIYGGYRFSAQDLGISVRSLFRYKRTYNIRYDMKKKEYCIVERIDNKKCYNNGVAKIV